MGAYFCCPSAEKKFSRHIFHAFSISRVSAFGGSSFIYVIIIPCLICLFSGVDILHFGSVGVGCFFSRGREINYDLLKTLNLLALFRFTMPFILCIISNNERTFFKKWEAFCSHYQFELIAKSLPITVSLHQRDNKNLNNFDEQVSPRQYTNNCKNEAVFFLRVTLHSALLSLCKSIVVLLDYFYLLLEY